MEWRSGAVTVEDFVEAHQPISADVLRARFLPSISTITLGLIRVRDRSLWLGPFELVRFGRPRVSVHTVSWPIEGGLLVASPGGRFAIKSTRGNLVATLDGYRPMLPRAIYVRTQLRLHHALVRIQLLRLAGQVPLAPQATPSSRFAAAAIDVAVCAGMALVFARRRRVRAFARFTFAYHLVAWSTSGQTIGGRVMHQRVVASDGSRVSLVQAALRMAALPLSAWRRYRAHDDVSATTVVET
jgi:hypothetical protein